ncbi:MAG: hypothetical protein U0132_20105 [Gemmatimonadaceae bacterium]
MALSLFAALLRVLATWALLASALCGLGLGVQRLLLGSHPTRQDLTDAAWLGFAALLFALLSWHLFFPINNIIATALLGGGLALSIAYRRLIAGALTSVPRAPWSVVMAVAVATWIAMRSMGEMTLYDSGMYHVPFVQWAKAYSVVPGLGNLHGRLAFNPASLLFAALLDRGPWQDGSQHVANGFLVALFTVTALRRLAAVRPPAPMTARVAFELTMTPAILVTALRQDVRSLSTDLPTFVLLAVAGGMLFELLAERVDDAARSRARHLSFFAVLGAMVTVKLSAAPFATVAALVLLLADRRWQRKDLARILILPVLSGIVWMAHGVILSGYPLYPSRILALPVDWRVSAEQAAAEAGWITMSARTLNTNVLVLSHEWISRWLGQVVTRGDLFHFFLAPLLVVVTAVWLLFRRSGRLSAAPWRRGLLVCIPIVLSVLVWWYTAPHPRMAQGPFWILASAMIAVAVGGATTLTVRQLHRMWLASAFLLAILIARMTAGDIVRAPAAERPSTILHALATIPTRSGWFWPTPEPDLLSDSLATGLQLAVPRVDNSCWNGPLLCTPHPTVRLTLRSPGDVSAGFRNAAPWAPEWFPNPWIPFLDYWRCTRRSGPSLSLNTLESSCRDATRGARSPATGT